MEKLVNAWARCCQYYRIKSIPLQYRFSVSLGKKFTFKMKRAESYINN
ncbi:hypothetical protein [Treponema socranskii]